MDRNPWLSETNVKHRPSYQLWFMLASSESLTIWVRPTEQLANLFIQPAAGNSRHPITHLYIPIYDTTDNTNTLLLATFSRYCWDDE